MDEAVKKLYAELSALDAQRRELKPKINEKVLEIRQAEANAKIAAMPAEEIAALRQIILGNGIPSEEKGMGQA